MIKRFIRHIKEGFVGVRRHLSMSLSSATAVTITLLLVGLFLVLTINLNALTTEIEDSISLSVLIDYDVNTTSERESIKSQIESIPSVYGVAYRNKDEEFSYYISQYSDEDVVKFYEVYRDDNPFHDVFLVNVESEQIASVKSMIEKIDGVDSVYDGGSNTYLLVDILQKTRIVGGILVLSLCFLAVYLIYNTIKITIASREDEIWIMRNVGAKNSFIRAPFLVEGIIIGLIGSIIPILVLGIGYYYLYDVTGGILLGVITLVDTFPFILYLALVIIAVGVVVGYFGSFFSVVKYLRHKR